MADQPLEEKSEKTTPEGNKKKKRGKGIWTVIGVIALALVIVGGSGGGYLLHLSNTSPQFCQTCHIMEKNVNSYLTSNDLDNIHFQANVQCKECHDYPVSAEVNSGVKFLTGNYNVNAEGNLPKRVYKDDMCLKCHISYDYIAEKTDFLKKNPHSNHNGELPCSTCHISHGDQVDYCSQCHDNGKQRLVGGEVEPRGMVK